MRKFLDNSGLFVCGTVLALAWANLAPISYHSVAGRLHFIVNDVAMAFFFALAAKEVVDATAPGGALHSPRRASLPIVAAVGGMAVPALIYVGLVRTVGAPELARGWAIPCATDIAFSYLVASAIFGRRHPAVSFLLLLAIADDALGLLIIALFYPAGPVRLLELGVLLAAAIALASWLRARSVVNDWSYLWGPGLLCWIAFLAGGLHPALALVPVVPFLRPHVRKGFEHRWKDPVQVILFFFGLVNAGVAVGNVGPGTWIVLTALVAGKPIGVIASVGSGLLLGLHKPAGVTWSDLIVVGVVAGIGFTVALFFATASFPPGALLDQTKMGALLSFSAAGLAVALSKALRRD